MMAEENGAGVPRAASVSRPTITLPPCSTYESLFLGRPEVSPGPMTLVSSFFAEEPESDGRSFSQLLAGAMTSPMAGLAGRAFSDSGATYAAVASSSDAAPTYATEKERTAGGGVRPHKPLGVMVAPSPFFTVPVGLSPACLLESPVPFSPELFYAKCISSEDYHSSKRPLLQRLAVQGVEVDCRDVIMGSSQTHTEEEEWSVIELNEKENHAGKENKPKHLSSIKGAMSLIGIASGKGKGKKLGSNQEPLASVDLNRPANSSAYGSFGEKPSGGSDGGTENLSVLMPEGSFNATVEEEKFKKKSFRTLFQKEQTTEGSGKKEPASVGDKRTPKSSRTPWGFDGLRKWKRNTWENEDTLPYLPPGERSDDASSLPCTLVPSPVGEGPDTKRIKKKMHPDGAASDFFIDKVLGENIKKELSRIQSELNTKNSTLSFSDEQIEAISTRLPVDKADLKKFFPKAWCDRYGDVVLDVVRKEFKGHVGEMEAMRNAAKERRESSEGWVAFDEDDGDFRTNLFFRDQTFLNEAPPGKGAGCFANNPFYDDQNAFWASSSGNPR